MAATRVWVLLFALACLAATAAACCKRKGDFGCCGNGPCNIFCCNCDGGCNDECENTKCDTGEWLKCAAIVTTCAGECADTLGGACVTCMGGSYEGCSKCCSSRRRSRTLLAPTADAHRNEFFLEVTGGGKDMTLEHFTTFVNKAKASEKKTASGTVPVADAFATYDANKDGVVSRTEFDALHDIKLEDVAM